MSIAHLQPLGVLVEHRVDDVDERLVAGEEAVPAGEQVALEPALALVLAQHLHHPPVGGEVVVVGQDLRDPGAVGDLEHVLPAVRVVLVRAEQPEVPRLQVELHHVAQVLAHDPGGLRHGRAGRGHLDGVVAEVRQAQVPEQGAAVGVRVGAHAPGALGRQLGQLGPEAAVLVEELLGPVAPHPRLEQRGRGPGSRASRPSAPGARASSPRYACRRSPSGRSTPWACGARSSASGGAR